MIRLRNSRALVVLLWSSVLFLAGCTAASALPVEVPPPLVITVVVTPAGGSPAATPDPAGTTSPGPGSSYPPPFQNTITAVYQDFERGFMIYLSDRKAIWVFVRSAGPSVNYGQWIPYADTFQDGELETDPTLVPPPSFQQPKRGFGKVWRENPVLRELVGWGLDYERAYTTTVIDYSIGAFDANGIYTPQSFIHTVGALDSSLIHIDEATRLWSFSQ